MPLRRRENINFYIQVWKEENTETCYTRLDNMDGACLVVNLLHSLVMLSQPTVPKEDENFLIRRDVEAEPER